MMWGFILVLFMSYGSIYGYDDEEIEEKPATNIPLMLSSESKIEATIGETVTFVCEVDNQGDYILLWKKGTNQILFADSLKTIKDSRFSIQGTSLVITNVNSKDNGNYTCQFSTTPPIELRHELEVFYPPSVKTHPKDGFVTIKEGETVTLSCNAKGHPKPVVSWKHAGRHYDSTYNSSFEINSAQKGDSGEYECIADNGVGDPASSVITLEVVSAPKVYPHPTSGLLTVKEGDTISISCEASGDPLPVITWKRPGGEKAMALREGNKIVISDANRNHAGSYECVATNSLGIFTSAIIRVQVQYPPEVKVMHSWIHAGEGNNVNITCNIKGFPIPSVSWKKGSDGQILYENDHYHMKTDGHFHTLEIRKLKEEDFGRYDCVASNPLSSVSENVHIIGTPQVPHFISKPHASQGTKYTIIWTVDSHTPVDEYSLMFRKKASNGEWETKKITASAIDGHTHKEMFQLENLVPSTSYEAVVTARNKFGWSKQSEALVFTTKKEDKISESALSSSPITYVNLMVVIPMALVSLYRNVL